MELEIKYICLQEEFLSIAQYYINENILNILKKYYAKYINSNRKLSQINDLKTLLKVLEKRDCLNYYNIEPLIYISNNFLNDFQIQCKVRDYKIYVQSIQYCLSFNIYQESKENKDDNKLSNISKNSTSQIKVSNEFENQSTLEYKNVKSNLFTQKMELQQTELQQTLLSHLSKRIGRSWRDTVRYLNIPEYQIDAIQNKHPFDLKEQSYEALKLYITQYSDNNWKINLIHALEKARRKDLKELSEKLILESNS
ncbi:fas-associated death domain protein [Apis laboriosa]|uniref:fas-associated death domain protein n=1 Tax=Apis laboriosa TaxID=183418 RepID=UPI001CC81718|nr:fas-associated death domain protein [Apis laboriosa]